MTFKLLAPLLFLTCVAVASAQEAGKSLSSTLDMYAFPKDGQTASQQSKDEASCYDWATKNTGSDPFAAQKAQAAAEQKTEQQVQEAQGATQGAGARGAVGGAAAGALIGEIGNDDAGKGAVWGAAVGTIAARRRAHAASAEAQQAAVSAGTQQIQASAEDIDNFKKAFSVCLEAKNYLVKY